MKPKVLFEQYRYIRNKYSEESTETGFNTFLYEEYAYVGVRITRYAPDVIVITGTYRKGDCGGTVRTLMNDDMTDFNAIRHAVTAYDQLLEEHIDYFPDLMQEGK
jgi:hypothetical protein